MYIRRSTDEEDPQMILIYGIEIHLVEPYKYQSFFLRQSKFTHFTRKIFVKLNTQVLYLSFLLTKISKQVSP